LLDGESYCVVSDRSVKFFESSNRFSDANQGGRVVFQPIDASAVAI
jgi:hypothetical protein